MVDLGLTIVWMGAGGATGGSGVMESSGRLRESHRKGFDKIDLVKVVLKPLYIS